jgi:hypothetical protein
MGAPADARQARPMDMNSPFLLVVSALGVGLMVLFVALLGLTGAGWVVGLALLGHAIATAVVVVAVWKMLDSPDRA